MEINNYINKAEREDFRLSRHYWSAVANATSKKITDQINESYKYSPEYIMLENERKSIIEMLWKEFKKKISAVDFAYLMKYISCQSNASSTASQVDISNKGIEKRIKKCQKLAYELLEEMGLTIVDFKESLVPEISNYISGSTHTAGYPFEHYMNLPVNKKWQDKFGTQRAKINKSCLIPEYLQACGLCNCQCNICTDTNNCRRKDAFPDNDRTGILKRSKAKVEECINNAIANTQVSAYSGLERIYQI